MIVVIFAAGKSFKGLAAYLTHDPGAKTAERVAWTHTFNLANDHVLSAVDEMLWTARSAELLKQQAGIRAGGRTTQNSCKHISLDWSPEDHPTREHMTETADGFLRHMKWHEHQAVVVAHNDKAHPHVHIMLNVIYPETGLRLDDNFEHRRAQKWALGYELENGRVHCEQRLQNPDEREDAPTRPAWQAFKEQQKKFEGDENILRNQAPILVEAHENSKISNSDEWKRLKEVQRHERQVFFAEGKSEFSELRGAIYREVREEYRERWSDYYSAQKSGTDASALTTIKTELLADQKAELDTRRDAACEELRKSRDERYRVLLDDQHELRQGLRGRQERGLDNAIFFQAIDEGKFRAGRPGFLEAASEVTAPRATQSEPPADDENFNAHKQLASGMRSGTDVGAQLGVNLGFGALSFLESLADGLIGATPAPKPKRAETASPAANPFEGVIEQARARQKSEQEDADREWRKKQRSYGE